MQREIRRAMALRNLADALGLVGGVIDDDAQRLGVPADDLLPRLAERVALSVALTAYEQWLAAEERSLPELLRNASAGLTSLFVPTAATP
jgi:hypothetical protein